MPSLYDDAVQKELTRPFDDNLVKQKGRYSYISHGLVTQRLNKVDPGWSNELMHVHTYNDQAGGLHCAGVTIALTIHGVSRIESGGPQRIETFTNEVKNAQSDALKRAAMRFGIALDMWEKLTDSIGDEDYDESYASGNEPLGYTDSGTPTGGGPSNYQQREAPRQQQTFPQRDSRPSGYGSQGGQNAGGGNRPAPEPGDAPTQRQLAFLRARAGEKGIDDVDQLAYDQYGRPVGELTRREVSNLIDSL